MSLAAAQAADGDAAPPRDQGSSGGQGGQHARGGNRTQFILKHADELGLSDEQKAKLNELSAASEAPGAAKGPEAMAAVREQMDAILTDVQRDKVKELFKARQAERSAGPADSTFTIPPAAPAAPPEPHAEDGVPMVDIINFVLTHKNEFFLREDQSDQLKALLPKPGAPQPDGADLKNKVWEVISGQQIGKLREMLIAEKKAKAAATK